MTGESFGFGSRLREARLRKGLTGEALGQGAGEKGRDASKQSVADWEHDRHYPKADQLRVLCLKLGVSADSLLFGSAEERENLTRAEQALQGLTPDQRRLLLARMLAPGVSSHIVEEPMPVTKTIKRKDRPQGPDSGMGEL